jgi:hypothetical protein
MDQDFFGSVMGAAFEDELEKIAGLPRALRSATPPRNAYTNNVIDANQQGRYLSRMMATDAESARRYSQGRLRPSEQKTYMRRAAYGASAKGRAREILDDREGSFPASQRSFAAREKAFGSGHVPDVRRLRGTFKGPGPYDDPEMKGIMLETARLRKTRAIRRRNSFSNRLKRFFGRD